MIERSLPFDAFPIRQCVRELVIPVLVRVLLLGVTQLPVSRRARSLSVERRDQTASRGVVRASAHFLFFCFPPRRRPGTQDSCGFD